MKHKHLNKIGRIIAATALMLFTHSVTQAQILFSAGSPYTQNFDSLASSGSTVTWTDNSTLVGWYASKSKVATTSYTVGAGAGNAGALYSFGTNGVNAITDRALGSVCSGTPGNIAYGVRFQNDTALAITNITIVFTGEQWRNGGNTSAQSLAFTYRKSSSAITDSDAANTATWIAATNFSSPTVGATATALDGNAPANRKVISVNLTGVIVAPGEEIFFRWYDVDDSGNDHGMGIDDLSVSYTTVAPDNNPPSISQNPTDLTVIAGNNARFSVTAAGQSPLTYQWYITNSVQNDPIGGATDSILNLATVLTNATSGYYVIVANGLGSATSSVANLTVIGAVATNIAYLHTLHDANYALTDTNTLFQIDGIVTTPVNMVTGTSVYSFFVQDGSGRGIDVFHRGGFAPNNLPGVGQHVRVTGPLASFNGLIEFSPIGGNPAHSIEVLDDGATQPLPTPYYLSVSAMASPATLFDLQGTYLVVSNVFLVPTNSTFISATASTVVLTNSSGTLPVVLLNPASATDPQGQTVPAYATSIKGVLGQYDPSSPFTSGYQLNLTLYSDIEVGTPPAPAPTISAFTNALTSLVVTNLTLTNGAISPELYFSIDDQGGPGGLVVGSASSNPSVANTATMNVSGNLYVLQVASTGIGTAKVDVIVTDSASVSTTNSVYVTVIPTSVSLNTQLVGGSGPSSLVLSWDVSAYALQSSTNVAGPYVNVPGATSPYTNNYTDSQRYFRLIYTAP